jgi:phosphohistidine phosphatase
MRRLMLLRHAKSDRTPGLEDHDRPLNARGRASAPAMGAYLAEQKLVPALIVCSTSLRTRQTYDLLAPSLPKSARVVFDEALYLAERDAILALVRALPKDAEVAMLIGHNPGLQEAAIALAGTGDADTRRRLHDKFPTAALAVIDFPRDDWASVRARNGRLERFATPKSATGTD